MKKTRILIVDDDTLARQLYSEYLGEAGYEVITARDAAQAAAALAAEPVDVVVTDLILPDADGLAVLAEAKRRDPGIEVIVITAVERVDPAVRAIKSGAADYLVKPVPRESLQLSVSRCLATRHLLQENALLRQHLTLVEAGQRLATTLDRETLLPLAARALRETLQASGVLLFTRSPDGRFSKAATDGLEPADAERLVALALPRLSQLSGRETELELDGETCRLLLAEAGGELIGLCLLRSPSRDALAWANAQFLASHLALALQSILRLSAAESLAYLDDLTKLHNMRYLHLALDREITNSRQTGAPFAVLFIDLDHFKEVNDTHGHLVGSKVLIELAGVLRSCVRDIDVAARYGGDEYVILLLGTDERGGMRVGERIQRAIAEHGFLAEDGLGLRLTACVGVASYPLHAQTKTQILECADQAMYRGKQTTRNTVYLADLPGESVSRTA
jgi:diguanylate cyclase (GGDEF)-like protein